MNNFTCKTCAALRRTCIPQSAVHCTTHAKTRRNLSDGHNIFCSCRSLNNMTNNSTNYSDLASGDVRNEILAQVEIGVLSAIFVLAITGNLFAVLLLLKLRRARPYSHMYLLMLHLSIADILVGVFNIFPQLLWKVTFRFHGPDVLCRCIKFLQVSFFYLLVILKK